MALMAVPTGWEGPKMELCISVPISGKWSFASAFISQGNGALHQRSYLREESVSTEDPHIA